VRDGFKRGGVVSGYALFGSLIKTSGLETATRIPKQPSERDQKQESGVAAEMTRTGIGVWGGTGEFSKLKRLDATC
jgi:hypothetical protein